MSADGKTAATKPRVAQDRHQSVPPPPQPSTAAPPHILPHPHAPARVPRGSYVLVKPLRITADTPAAAPCTASRLQVLAPTDPLTPIDGSPVDPPQTVATTPPWTRLVPNSASTAYWSPIRASVRRSIPVGFPQQPGPTYTPLQSSMWDIFDCHKWDIYSCPLHRAADLSHTCRSALPVLAVGPLPDSGSGWLGFSGLSEIGLRRRYACPRLAVPLG